MRSPIRALDGLRLKWHGSPTVWFKASSGFGGLMDKPLQSVTETTAAVDGHLQVALDNMPGALVYTDEDLNIVFCNERFRKMYPVPADLLRPGQPYPHFLRYLATHGYYGKGDVDTMVARRVESLRHPTGKSFEDITPDGRCYRIHRRRAAGGGTVTVMTDVTRHKQAEQDLASKEAEFHLVLDNMPGALVHTDEELKIVFCNDRFKEMYPVPATCFGPANPIPSFCAISRHTATTAKGTSMRSSRGVWKACVIPPAESSRTLRRTGDAIEFTAEAQPPAVP